MSRRVIMTPLLFLALSFVWAPVVVRAEINNTAPEEVVRATLENGLRVVIVPNNLAPVVTTVMNYLVGSNEAPPGFPGTAHALEHMMFRGSPELSAGQLANITAALGGEFNADTQQTVTQYFFTVPAADLEIPLRLEAIRLRGLLADEQLWDQERGAIEQEVAQDLSNPQYVFYTRLLAALFKGTPYAHDALGTKPSFDRTTAALLKNFHDTWYVPNNAILVIAGKVEPQKTLKLVKELFGSIAKKELPAREPVRLEPVRPEKMALQTDLPFGLVVCAWRFPGYDSPDYAAAKVLADILASRRGNLYALAAQGKALTTDFDLTALPQAGLGAAMASFPKGGKAAALLQQVKETIREWPQQGFDPDLVAAAKKRAAARLEFKKGSVSGLALAWSDALAVEGRQSPAEDLQAIEKVTAADVDRVARKYLNPDRAITAVLTPTASGKPVTTGGFGRRETVQIKSTGKVTLP
jgi:zinc protease